MVMLTYENHFRRFKRTTTNHVAAEQPSLFRHSPLALYTIVNIFQDMEPPTGIEPALSVLQTVRLPSASSGLWR